MNYKVQICILSILDVSKTISTSCIETQDNKICELQLQVFQNICHTSGRQSVILQVTHLDMRLLDIALCPMVPWFLVKLTERCLLCLRGGEGLDTRILSAEASAQVSSKYRRYEDILSGLRLIVMPLQPLQLQMETGYWTLTLSSQWWAVFIFPSIL